MNQLLIKTLVASLLTTTIWSYIVYKVIEPKAEFLWIFLTIGFALPIISFLFRSINIIFASFFIHRDIENFFYDELSQVKPPILEVTGWPMPAWDYYLSSVIDYEKTNKKDAVRLTSLLTSFEVSKAHGLAYAEMTKGSYERGLLRYMKANQDRIDSDFEASL